MEKLKNGRAQPLCLQTTAQFSAWWSSCGVAYTASLFYGLWGIYYFVLRKSVWLPKSSSSLAGSPSQIVNFLQLLLLCCLVCSLCWLTGWISLLWGNEVLLWIGKVTCMEIDNAVHNCKCGGGISEVGERCCAFLRLLGATYFSSHRPSSSWGLFPLWGLLTGHRQAHFQSDPLHLPQWLAIDSGLFPVSFILPKYQPTLNSLGSSSI